MGNQRATHLDIGRTAEPPEDTPTLCNVFGEQSENVTYDSEILTEIEEIEEIDRDLPGRENPRRDNPYTLGITAFVQWAIEEHVNTQGEEYEHGTAWHTPLWTFVRLCKGYFDRCGDGDADEAFDAVDAVVQQLPGGWVGSFDVLDDEDAYAEFTACWHKVRYRPGFGPLPTAIKMAKEQPLIPARCEKRKLDGYMMFVSAAGWLQVCMGNKSIMLPCRKVAEHLTGAGVKCTQMTVKRWRDWALADGYLVVTGEHKYHPGGRNISTRFRFDVSRWDVLSKKAEKGS